MDKSNVRIDNRTLLGAINYSINDEREWYEKLPQIVLGINNAENSSTHLTPHKLMFGFEKNILADLGDDSTEEIDRDNDKNIATNAMNRQSHQMKKIF